MPQRDATAGTLNDSDDRAVTSNKFGNKTDVKEKIDRVHDRHNAAPIGLADKSTGSKATTRNEKGQEREDGEVLVAAIGGNQVTGARKKTNEIMQQSSDVGVNKEVEQILGTTSKSGQISTDAAKGWAVVNRSPDRKVASSHQNLESAAETIRCTNSFDALANAYDHGEKDARKSLEFVDGKSVSQAGQNSSPSSGKQQQQSSNRGAPLNVSKDVVLSEEPKAVTASAAPAPTIHITNEELVPVSSSNKRDQSSDIGARLEIHRTDLGLDTSKCLTRVSHFNNPQTIFLEKLASGLQNKS
ncbi:hypothetical protein A4A49_21980 [Nicotiana attenuata]|uniref:Uncharacterized protein n=1 Tax=Nicotiana attenuata TaxID=49451 RepID=A0A1J6IL11_NICAT|nr:hypothetical protein A4A49_21980 [Nicotiana attenuata]